MALINFPKRKRKAAAEVVVPMMEQAKGTFTILNDKGLHTRPATELVKCTTRYKSHIELTFHKVTVNGKSLLGVLMLAAARGSKIDIEAEGEDAAAAVRAVLDLANHKFNISY